MCLILLAAAAGVVFLVDAIMSIFDPRMGSALNKGAIGVGLLVVSAIAYKLLIRSAEKQIGRDNTARGVETSQPDEIIKCPNCANGHSRAEVVAVLKAQSPEMFAFGTWSTRFKCRRCQHEIWISGSGLN